MYRVTHGDRVLFEHEDGNLVTFVFGSIRGYYTEYGDEDFDVDGITLVDDAGNVIDLEALAAIPAPPL